MMFTGRKIFEGGVQNSENIPYIWKSMYQKMMQLIRIR